MKVTRYAWEDDGSPRCGNCGSLPSWRTTVYQIEERPPLCDKCMAPDTLREITKGFRDAGL